MTRLGLVTVLYNGAEVLEDFFKSLARQSYSDWFIEIIDNSPDDRARATAEALINELGIVNAHLTVNAENYGVARGNNQGIEKCLTRGCDAVLLLNNDIEFTDADLFSAIARAVGEENHDIVVPKIYFHDSGKIWFAGGTMNRVAGTTRHIGEGREEAPEDSAQRSTAYAPTCFMAISNRVFEKVGLMDERYFVYYDDTDFVARCVKSGFSIYYDGRLSISHKVSSSTGQGSPFQIYYYNRNRILFLRKHGIALLRPLSFLWYFMTRAYKFLIYSGSERPVLIKAVRDGLRLR